LAILATVFPNPRGTAPGLALSDPALGTTVLLPDVPSELRALFDEQVLPYLGRVLGPGRPIMSRTLRTTGLAESAVAERLAGLLDDLPHLALAYLPTGIGIDLRLTSWGELAEPEAALALTEAERRLRRLAGDIIYGRDRDDLAAVVGARLRERELKLAVAESCTGGLLSARLTAVPDSSDYFLGGAVAYADTVKQALLGVSADTLRLHGAVSEAVALELARGALLVTGADCSLAITGVAGPGGGTAEKPVGTVWIALGRGAHAEAVRHRFPGTRDEIRTRAAQAALAWLWRALS
jgi:nicotinamide-nucleotide amidase